MKESSKTISIYLDRNYTNQKPGGMENYILVKTPIKPRLVDQRILSTVYLAVYRGYIDRILQTYK